MLISDTFNFRIPNFFMLISDHFNRGRLLPNRVVFIIYSAHSVGRGGEDQLFLESINMLQTVMK